jgi:hypothetical protein
MYPDHVLIDRIHPTAHRDPALLSVEVLQVFISHILVNPHGEISVMANPWKSKLGSYKDFQGRTRRGVVEGSTYYSNKAPAF